MNNNLIPIFFTIDDSYAPFLSVALSSAIKNRSENRLYKAIILSESLNEENKAKLSSLQTENFKIEFVTVSQGLETITDRMSNRLRCDYFTLTIYFRLFIPAMFPMYDKGIYIDSDVVINGDLAELFDTELKSNYIAACRDLSVSDVPPLVEYMENAVGVPKDCYINSGVLLMNLKALREAELDKHFLTLLNTYGFDCIAPDQDYLNAMCYGKILYLPEAFDAMPNNAKPPLKDAKIIHYNLFSKPWCYDDIQYSEYFWQYAESSDYADEIRRCKENYSNEKKAADSACLELLLRRGHEIANSDITFKKLFENGVKIRL